LYVQKGTKTPHKSVQKIEIYLNYIGYDAASTTIVQFAVRIVEDF
jgi:hypothetical protein